MKVCQMTKQLKNALNKNETVYSEYSEPKTRNTLYKTKTRPKDI